MGKSLQGIIQIIDDRVQLMENDIIEPLNMYIQHHNGISESQQEKANEIMNNFRQAETDHRQAQIDHYNLGSKQETNEINIEKALLQKQQGEIDDEKLQEVMNESVNTLYQTQQAEQRYKETIENLNKAKDEMENDYKAVLQQLQQYEESRINYTKYNFDKFLKHVQ